MESVNYSISSCTKEPRDKDGNEISITKDVLLEVGESISGMIPLAGEIYTGVFQGYEADDIMMSGVNTFIQSFNGFLSLSDSIMSKEYVEPYKYGRAVKDVTNGLSLFTGIPVHNIARYTVAAVEWFNPSLALKYDSMFYFQEYGKNINKFIEKGDTESAKTTLNEFLKYKGISSYDSVNKEVLKRYKSGMTLPKKIANTYGETTH